MDANMKKRNELLAKTVLRDWNPAICPGIMHKIKKQH